MSNYECLGKWRFEDIECMTCKKESECSSIKRGQEKQYAMSKHNEKCKNCINIIKCTRSLPRICFGDEDVYDENKCHRCKCGTECWLKCRKEIRVLCIKSVTCSICEENNKFIKFEAGNEYNLIKIGNRLYGKDQYEFDAIIFRDYKSNPVFKKYFCIL